MAGRARLLVVSAVVAAALGGSSGAGGAPPALTAVSADRVAAVPVATKAALDHRADDVASGGGGPQRTTSADAATRRDPWTRDHLGAAGNDLHSATGEPAVIVTPGADVPNPFVLVDRGVHYLYATQQHFYEKNVPVRVGRTRVSYAPPVEAMPVVPPWAGPGMTWAPDVRRIGDTYVMWFTAPVKRLPLGRRGHPVMCIGVATAASPLGPFVSTATEPAICQLDRHGSIDARTFRDVDGRLWLHWKSDDNADPGGGPPAIFAQRLARDGMTLLSRATEIMTADQLWEGPIVEAPQMVVGGGRHWLFYSANWFNQDAYAIGIASCAGPAGPCTKPSPTPWLASNAQGRGPGEASLFEDDDGLWIVYSPTQASYGPRPVAIAQVALTDAGPQLTR